MPLTVTLDGEPIQLVAPASIEQLLRDQGLSPEILSVMLNGYVLHRHDYPETTLADGDELVAVVQVGGG